MRTVHGQYRRKVKIPKEEVFGAKEPETPPIPTRKNSVKSETENSPNKRKSSSPLKVKLPFKIKTKDELSAEEN